MSMNASKYQGYNTYGFWAIKGKPTRGGGEGADYLPLPPRLGLNKNWLHTQ